MYLNGYFDKMLKVRGVVDVFSSLEVDASVITLGASYIISVTLCNIFNRCDNDTIVFNALESDTLVDVMILGTSRYSLEYNRASLWKNFCKY